MTKICLSPEEILKEFSYSSLIADFIEALIFGVNSSSADAFKSMLFEDSSPEADIDEGSEKEFPNKFPAISLTMDIG